MHGHTIIVSIFVNHQIRHKATSKRAVSLVIADGHFSQSSSGVCMGKEMYRKKTLFQEANEGGK